MKNSAINKLKQSRRNWKNTVGEYALRLTGIGLALTAVAIGLFYSYGREVPPLEAGTSYIIKRRHDPSVQEILVVTEAARKSRRAWVDALEEAISSYYGVRITTISGDYSDPNVLKKIDGVIVLGGGTFKDGAGLRKLVKVVAERGLPLLWIGSGLSGVAAVLGLNYSGEKPPAPAPPNSYLLYKGAKIPATGLPFVQGDLNAEKGGIEVLATLKLHDLFSRPAIMQYGRLIYVPFIPFVENGAPLVATITMDALSRMMGKHPRDPRVIFRLDDVNGRTYGASDTSFGKTVNYLLGEEVPVHMAIIPTMVDAEGNVVADIGAAGTALDFAKRYPGKIEIVQHGTLHYRKDPRNKGKASGDAYEFFFDDDQTMGKKASQKFARLRLQEGYALMARNDLYPKMFEAPHLEMSPAQQEIADSMYPIMLHPPLFYGRNAKHYSALLPWLTQRNTTVYAPGDVGYVDALRKDSVKVILSKLEKLANIFQDPIVVVFFHPFMIEKEERERDLPQLIKGIKGLGYRFVNIYDELEPLRTKTD